MADESAAELEGRVLLLAPTKRDAAAAGRIFAAVGIVLTLCADIVEVCREIERGAAVAIVPDEAILNDGSDASPGSSATSPRGPTSRSSS